MLSATLEIPTRQPRPAANRAWWRFLPLALVAVVYLTASLGPALFDQNESQYAGAVREMLNRPQDYVAATRGQLERGHWYIPSNDGIPRLQKPPLVYWFLMGSMRVFGVNEFAARLPNALFSLGWFAATFLLARRIAGRAFGAAAAAVLATMAGTFIFSHLVAPEPFLATFLTLTFWCFLSACQQPARAGRWMFLAWIFMGLGVDTKGLHGALYPLAVAGWLAWRHTETRSVWRRLWQPAGPLVCLALLVPWYAAIGARFPGFLYDQFINEQWGHAVNHRFPPDNNSVPLWLFALEHLIFFLPWTFFIPAAWQVKSVPASTNEKLGHRLLTTWFVVTLATLLFSSLQDYYLMTAFVPVACWFARVWQPDGIGHELPRWTRLLPGAALSALGVLALAAGIYLATQVSATPGSVGTAAPSAIRDTIAATLAGFSSSVWHRLLPLVWLTGGVFVAGGICALLLAPARTWRAVPVVAAVTMAVMLLVAWQGMVVLEDYFSLKRVALAANARAGLHGQVVCEGEPVDNPSLLFYLNREIYWVHAHPAGEFASRELKIGLNLFLSEADFARRWQSAETVFLITEADAVSQWRDRLALTPVQAEPVARSGTRVLLVNRAGP